MSDLTTISVPEECIVCTQCKRFDQMYAEAAERGKEATDIQTGVAINTPPVIRIGCLCTFPNDTAWKTDFFPDQIAIKEWNYLNEIPENEKIPTDYEKFKIILDELNIPHTEMGMHQTLITTDIFAFEFDENGNLIELNGKPIKRDLSQI